MKASILQKLIDKVDYIRQAMLGNIDIPDTHFQVFNKGQEWFFTDMINGDTYGPFCCEDEANSALHSYVKYYG
jgi:hypothetical protein